VGPKHSREQILDAAVRVAVGSGLGALSFRRVAEEAATSDRMVVYYFDDKSHLFGAILGRAGGQLQAMLTASLPSTRQGHLSRLEILQAARGVFTDPQYASVIRLFLEAVGLAVAGTEPFATLAPTLLAQWVAWLDEQMGDSAVQPGEAAATVAVIDGLMIVGSLLGADAEAAAWDAVIAGARHPD
jgi:AcrR family transcriptional regulator